jgi:hypothetical protein
MHCHSYVLTIFGFEAPQTAKLLSDCFIYKPDNTQINVTGGSFYKKK